MRTSAEPRDGVSGALDLLVWSGELGVGCAVFSSPGPSESESEESSPRISSSSPKSRGELSGVLACDSLATDLGLSEGVVAGEADVVAGEAGVVAAEADVVAGEAGVVAGEAGIAVVALLSPPLSEFRVKTGLLLRESTLVGKAI